MYNYESDTNKSTEQSQIEKERIQHTSSDEYESSEEKE